MASSGERLERQRRVKRVSVRELRAACREVTGGARVLLVDDEEALTSVIARALRRAGHSVDVARTLREVRQLFGPWEVVVFDYLLPDGKTTALAAEMARAGTARHVVSYSGAAPEDAPIGDHVLSKATSSPLELVALVSRLATLP